MNPVINSLLTRRSVLANNLQEPGPNAEEINILLEAAHRVPDHGKIGPWRFILFKEEARQTFSAKLGQIFQDENPEANQNQIEFEQNRLTRAPLVIAVISSPNIDHKVPLWEQELAVGAVCQNLLIAANSLGYGAQWLTEWYSYHQSVNTLLELEDHEKIAGFIYIGSFTEKPKERIRPNLSDKILLWR